MSMGEKTLIPYTFNILAHFFFYHFHGKLSIWKMLICTLFEEEGGLRKYVLYTHLNIDNYGRPLNRNIYV